VKENFYEKVLRFYSRNTQHGFHLAISEWRKGTYTYQGSSATITVPIPGMVPLKTGSADQGRELLQFGG
jgi:hypothetical protein